MIGPNDPTNAAGGEPDVSVESLHLELRDSLGGTGLRALKGLSLTLAEPSVLEEGQHRALGTVHLVARNRVDLDRMIQMLRKGFVGRVGKNMLRNAILVIE